MCVVVVVVVVFAQKKILGLVIKFGAKWCKNNFSVKIREQQKQQNYRG